MCDGANVLMLSYCKTDEGLLEKGAGRTNGAL